MNPQTKNPITVLVTGVGGGVGQSVIKGLRLASRTTPRQYNIIGCDANPLAAGLYRADHGCLIPFAKAPDFASTLVKLCNQYNVDAVIPGSDPEVAALSKIKDQIENQTRARLIVSSPEAVEIGKNKWQTFLFFKEHGFLTPETVLPGDIQNGRTRLSFPIIIKPRTGSASKGLFIARDEEELAMGIKRCKDPIIQEYIFPDNWKRETANLDYLSRQLDEYSVEVLVSKEGKILGSIANWREMVKGVPTRAIIDDFDEIRKVSEDVVKHLDILGPINLQLRKSEQGITYFEINVRFSGSTAVRCAAGFNGPDTMIRDVVLGETIEPQDLAYKKLVEMRFKDELYITPEDYEQIKSGTPAHGQGQILGYF